MNSGSWSAFQAAQNPEDQDFPDEPVHPAVQARRNAVVAILDPQFYDRLDKLPRPIAESLWNYILYGVETGSFLRAVLENNLLESFRRADPINTPMVREYVIFLYCWAPSPCWGNPERVAAWIKSFEFPVA